MSGGKGRAGVLAVLEAYALVLLLVATSVFFSFYAKTSGTFPTTANAQILVSGQSVLAIVALAELIPLLCNEFDLSVGATAGLSSVYVASLMSSGTPVWLAILIGIALGALVGLIHALLITRARINAVIVTLGTATLIEGVVTMKTKGVSLVANIPTGFANFGAGTTFGIPQPFLALLVVALGVYYLLGHTPFGRYLYAMGSNQEAARLVGLRTDRLLGLSFIAAGALAGAAGVLQVARSGGADPRVGPSFLLPAFAAAFLSAAAIKPGRYNVAGVLVAIFFLAVLNSGLNLAGAAPYVASYVNGAALLVGVGLAAFLGRKRALST